jgi:hypothetical protein
VARHTELANAAAGGRGRGGLRHVHAMIGKLDHRVDVMSKPGVVAVERSTSARPGAVEVYRVGGTDENPDIVAKLSVGRRRSGSRTRRLRAGTSARSRPAEGP